MLNLLLPPLRKEGRNFNSQGHLGEHVSERMLLGNSKIGGRAHCAPKEVLVLSLVAATYMEQTLSTPSL